MQDDRSLTWASLLAHWATFARASRSLPATPDGSRWKQAVPEIIGLQAVTFALADLHGLPADEFALGQDRADILITQHTRTLEGLWQDEALPPQLGELVADARVALQATRSSGLEFRVLGERIVCEHPAELVEALLSDPEPFSGDLFLASPGAPIMPSSPAAFIRGRRGQPVDAEILNAIRQFLGGKRAVSEAVHAAGLRQVYRQFDFGKPGRNAGPVRDAIAAREGVILPGQPLLVPAILAGEAQAVPMPIRGMDQIEDVPVVQERGE